MASIDSSEVKNIILLQILTSSAIKTLVSNRVYPAHISQIVDPEYPCIAFMLSGQGFRDLAEFNRALDTIMDVWCYGEVHKGYETPRALDRHLTDTIDRQGIQNTTFNINVMCSRMGDPIEGFDPDSSIPYVTSRWQVTALGS